MGQEGVKNEIKENTDRRLEHTLYVHTASKLVSICRINSGCFLLILTLAMHRVRAMNSTLVCFTVHTLIRLQITKYRLKTTLPASALDHPPS